MAKQICISLDYDLGKVILEIRTRALQAGTSHPTWKQCVTLHNTEGTKNSDPTKEEIEKEIQGLWKYVDQKVPPEIWGSLSAQVRKAYGNKRRKYHKGKKNNPGREPQMNENSNNGTRNICFSNGEGNPTEGPSLIVLRNNGNQSGETQGRENVGSPILPSNLMHIRNLVSTKQQPHHAI